MMIMEAKAPGSITERDEILWQLIRDGSDLATISRATRLTYWEVYASYRRLRRAEKSDADRRNAKSDGLED